VNNLQPQLTNSNFNNKQADSQPNRKPKGLGFQNSTSVEIKSKKKKIYLHKIKNSQDKINLNLKMNQFEVKNFKKCRNCISQLEHQSNQSSSQNFELNHILRNSQEIIESFGDSNEINQSLFFDQHSKNSSTNWQSLNLK